MVKPHDDFIPIDHHIARISRLPENLWFSHHWMIICIHAGCVPALSSTWYWYIIILRYIMLPSENTDRSVIRSLYILMFLCPLNTCGLFKMLFLVAACRAGRCKSIRGCGWRTAPMRACPLTHPSWTLSSGTPSQIRPTCPKVHVLAVALSWVAHPFSNPHSVPCGTVYCGLTLWFYSHQHRGRKVKGVQIINYMHPIHTNIRLQHVEPRLLRLDLKMVAPTAGNRSLVAAHCCTRTGRCIGNLHCNLGT